jgi:hypothetical protein
VELVCSSDGVLGRILCIAPGHVRSRESSWRPPTSLDDATVTSQIKRIRAKFAGVGPAFDAVGQSTAWATLEV